MTKTSPPDVDTARSAAAFGKQAAASPPGTASSPTPDRIDIRPLDEAAALQILIAEVRAGLQLPADAVRAQGTVHTAQIVAQMMLQALPDEAAGPLPADPADFGTADHAATGTAPAGAPDGLDALDTAVHAALERAVATVAAWRNVPDSVIASVRDTRALIATVLNDPASSALWGRPEWAWLAPRMQRYWRRRRSGRGRSGTGLSDPDPGHSAPIQDEERPCVSSPG